jgi:hypothetical protein
VDINIGEHIDTMLAIIAGGATNLWQWLSNRRRSELEDIEKGLVIYKDMLLGLKTEIDDLKKKLEEEKVYWKKRYDDLKKDFDKYRQEHP